jgi:hypothetical protein
VISAMLDVSQADAGNVADFVETMVDTVLRTSIEAGRGDARAQADAHGQGHYEFARAVRISSACRRPSTTC